MALAIMTPKMPASQFPSVTNARIPPVAPLKAMTTSRTSAKRRKEKPSSVPESGLSVATVEDFHRYLNGSFPVQYALHISHSELELMISCLPNEIKFLSRMNGPLERVGTISWFTRHSTTAETDRIVVQYLM
jgi:hypothetical protein